MESQSQTGLSDWTELIFFWDEASQCRWKTDQEGFPTIYAAPSEFFLAMKKCELSSIFSAVKVVEFVIILEMLKKVYKEECVRKFDI